MIEFITEAPLSVNVVRLIVLLSVVLIILGLVETWCLPRSRRLARFNATKNYPWRTAKTLGGWAKFVVNFGAYLFDLHSDLNAGQQFDVGAQYRLRPDRERFLHMIWHSVVYFPVIVVAGVAWVLGADPEDIAFFVMVASATVSLEICIGIVLDKAHGLENLSRQTKRAIDTFQHDCEKLSGWLRYLHLRHAAAREGVAKAALVTAVSLVLFGTIVGIEAIRLKGHSREHQRELLDYWSKGQEETIWSPENVVAVLHNERVPNNSEHATEDGEHADQHRTHGGHGSLLYLAISLSTVMVFLATVKLWIQTRATLEKKDAMDRYENPDDAIEVFERDPVFHFSDHYYERNPDEGEDFVMEVRGPAAEFTQTIAGAGEALWTFDTL